MIKANEAQSIRNTYEHIVRRLKDERLSFNNQLTALERTLKAKKRDMDELYLMSGDAHHAKELAHHELLEARHLYEQKRNKRDGELRERQQVLKIRRQMIEKQERRSVSKTRNVAFHEANECKSHQKTAAGGQDEMSCKLMLEKDLEEEQIRKLKMYEEMLEKIKKATGASTLEHMIDKIKDQKDASLELQRLTKLNQEIIENMRREKVELLKTRVDTLDFSARTEKALNTASIRTLGGIVQKTADDLLDLDGFGQKSLDEVTETLATFKLTLKDNNK